MNNPVKYLLVNALALLCAHGVLAGTIKVRLDGDDAAAKRIAESTAARLQETERYTVTNGDDEELDVALGCVDQKEVGRGHRYVCAFVVSYDPEKLFGLHLRLGPWLVWGDDVPAVSKQLLTSFVGATTDERLERAQKGLRLSVVLYCHSSTLDKNVNADCGRNADK
jgi:hypothetical protein